MVALKSLLFLMVIPGTVLVLIPSWILEATPLAPLPLGPFRQMGLLPVGFGAIIVVWCVWDFTFKGKGTPAPIDPPTRLVATGLYRFVRNPMYLGVLLVLFGEGLFFQSVAILLYGTFLFLLFHAFIRFYEEPALSKKFGPEYREYLHTVPRWIPRKPR